MRIMVAVDVHDAPDTLVQKAVAWAERMGGALDLVFASEAHGLVPVDPRDDAAWATERNGESRRLEALVERIPRLLRGQARLLVGRPIDVLPYATLGYDLIMVGTHGAGDVAVGSVAERLVRTSRAPVLALRLSEAAAAA